MSLSRAYLPSKGRIGEDAVTWITRGIIARIPFVPAMQKTATLRVAGIGAETLVISNIEAVLRTQAPSESVLLRALSAATAVKSHDQALGIAAVPSELVRLKSKDVAVDVVTNSPVLKVKAVPSGNIRIRVEQVDIVIEDHTETVAIE